MRKTRNHIPSVMFGLIGVCGSVSAAITNPFDLSPDGPSAAGESESLAATEFSPAADSDLDRWDDLIDPNGGHDFTPPLETSEPALIFTSPARGRGGSGPIGHSDQGPVADGLGTTEISEIEFIPHSDQNRPDNNNKPFYPRFEGPGLLPPGTHEDLGFSHSRSVPAPGPAMLLIIGGGLAASRRRRD